MDLPKRSEGHILLLRRPITLVIRLKYHSKQNQLNLLSLYPYNPMTLTAKLEHLVCENDIE